MAKAYIGDGAYVDFDGYALVLTTENGLPTDPSNQIVLEPSVYRSLADYVKALADDAVDPVGERVTE